MRSHFDVFLTAQNFQNYIFSIVPYFYFKISNKFAKMWTNEENHHRAVDIVRNYEINPIDYSTTLEFRFQVFHFFSDFIMFYQGLKLHVFKA